MTQVIWLEAPNPEKPQFQFFFLNQLLKDEIEKKNIITKKILKEKIEINRMRVKFEEEKKREGG